MKDAPTFYSLQKTALRICYGPIVELSTLHKEPLLILICSHSFSHFTEEKLNSYITSNDKIGFTPSFQMAPKLQSFTFYHTATLLLLIMPPINFRAVFQVASRLIANIYPRPVFISSSAAPEACEEEQPSTTPCLSPNPQYFRMRLYWK